MTLKEAQDRAFELLCVIDDICRKEGIRYFLDGGTEIGAVREKDIIAWDDDVDIQLRQEDYPAFKKAMDENLPEYYKVLEPAEFAPRFYDFLVRVIDTRYHLREEKEEDRFYDNKQNYLGIDVFLHFRGQPADIGPQPDPLGLPAESGTRVLFAGEYPLSQGKRKKTKMYPCGNPKPAYSAGIIIAASSSTP